MAHCRPLPLCTGGNGMLRWPIIINRPVRKKCDCMCVLCIWIHKAIAIIFFTLPTRQQDGGSACTDQLFWRWWSPPILKISRVPSQIWCPGYAGWGPRLIYSTHLFQSLLWIPVYGVHCFHKSSPKNVRQDLKYKCKKISIYSVYVLDRYKLFFPVWSS